LLVVPGGLFQGAFALYNRGVELVAAADSPGSHSTGSGFILQIDEVFCRSRVAAPRRITGVPGGDVVSLLLLPVILPDGSRDRARAQ
jgi:hypothetical protein